MNQNTNNTLKNKSVAPDNEINTKANHKAPSHDSTNQSADLSKLGFADAAAASGAIPTTYPCLNVMERAQRNIIPSKFRPRTASYVADVYAALDEILYTDINIDVKDDLYQPMRIVMGAYLTYVSEMRPLDERCLTSIFMLSQIFLDDISKMVVSETYNAAGNTYTLIAPGIEEFTIGKLYNKLLSPSSTLSLLGRGFWQAMYTMDVTAILQINNIIFSQLGIYYQAPNFTSESQPLEDGTERQQYTFMPIPIMYAIEDHGRNSILSQKNLLDIGQRQAIKKPARLNHDDLLDLDKVYAEKKAPLRASKGTKSLRPGARVTQKPDSPDAAKTTVNEIEQNIAVNENQDFIKFEFKLKETPDGNPVHS